MVPVYKSYGIEYLEEAWHYHVVTGIGVRYPGCWELGSGKSALKLANGWTAKPQKEAGSFSQETSFRKGECHWEDLMCPFLLLLLISISNKSTLLKMQTFILAHKGLITQAHPSEHLYLHKTISEFRTVSTTHREQRFPLTSYKSVPINSMPSTRYTLKRSRCLVCLPCRSNTILFTYYVFQNRRNL